MPCLIVEDALRDRKGHWFEYLGAFARELRALSDQVTVLADRAAEPFLVEQLQVQPVQPACIWHRMGDGAGALRRYLRNSAGGGRHGISFRLLTSLPRVAFSAQPLTLYRVHSVNKITQDEGTSKARRIIDWARCLKFMMERWDSCGLKPDAMTRLIFLAGARKHLRYLRAFPDAPVELVEYLSTRVAQASDLCLASVEWGSRLAEQARLRTNGSRWMAGYQAAAPSEHQLRLIRELGLQLAANA